MNAQDEKFMRSALKLAAKGIGSVEPNPAVGCIIVKAGQVIGKGYHRKFGGPHAEINAIEDCQTLGIKPEGGTMYVTLEPCSHEGKTGPCTQAIIDAGLLRVVAATIDPSPHAGGRGLEQLRQAGVDVETGLCEQEARQLNAPFFKYTVTGRPWVVLKWAQSLDGKLAYVDQSDEKRWITNEASRNDVHKLRRRVGAILVGINTVLADDPLLTPRPSRGKKPIRIVLDDTLKIPLECRLVATAQTDPVLVYAGKAAVDANLEHADQLSKKGAEVLTHDDPCSAPGLCFLLDELGRRGVQQVLQGPLLPGQRGQAVVQQPGRQAGHRLGRSRLHAPGAGRGGALVVHQHHRPVAFGLGQHLQVGVHQEGGRADGQKIVGGQPGAALDAPAVDEHAVEAVQVLDLEVRPGARDPGVALGHPAVDELQIATRVASDHASPLERPAAAQAVLVQLDEDKGSVGHGSRGLPFVSAAWTGIKGINWPPGCHPEASALFASSLAVRTCAEQETKIPHCFA